LLGSWFADTAALHRLAADAPLNTDDHPRVLFAAPVWNFRRSVPSYSLLEILLARSRGAPDGMLAQPAAGSGMSESFPSRLRAYTGARDQYLRGLIAQTEGKPGAAVEAFLESAKMSPDFTSGYAQILARATQRAHLNPQEARQLLERLIEVRPDRPVARELLERLTPR
jgi:spermidine synthase